MEVDGRWVTNPDERVEAWGKGAEENVFRKFKAQPEAPSAGGPVSDLLAYISHVLAVDLGIVGFSNNV